MMSAGTCVRSSSSVVTGAPLSLGLAGQSWSVPRSVSHSLGAALLVAECPNTTAPNANTMSGPVRVRQVGAMRGYPSHRFVAHSGRGLRSAEPGSLPRRIGNSSLSWVESVFPAITGPFLGADYLPHGGFPYAPQANTRQARHQA